MDFFAQNKAGKIATILSAVLFITMLLPYFSVGDLSISAWGIGYFFTFYALLVIVNAIVQYFKCRQWLNITVAVIGILIQVGVFVIVQQVVGDINKLTGGATEVLGVKIPAVEKIGVTDFLGFGYYLMLIMQIAIILVPRRFNK